MERESVGDVRFAKGHALGNDYIVMDEAAVGRELTPGRVRAVCDRFRGIGSDGVLLGRVAPGRIALRIFNPDGSEAEKSGNGLRIFAAWLHGRGDVAGDPFTVWLPQDRVELQVVGGAGSAGGELDVVADMGHASFRGADAGFLPEAGEVRRVDLDVAGERVTVQPVSMGNPHCVVFVDALRREEFLRLAPGLVGHASFAAGTNVQFARRVAGDRLQAWVWERGAGETQASGSSACAVAAAAHHLGLVSARQLTVEMPGGSLEVELREDGMVRLRGPARIVFDGMIHGGVWEEWQNA